MSTLGLIAYRLRVHSPALPSPKTLTLTLTLNLILMDIAYSANAVFAYTLVKPILLTFRFSKSSLRAQFTLARVA